MSERYVTETSRLEKSSLGITDVYDVMPLLVMGKIFSIMARCWDLFVSLRPELGSFVRVWFYVPWRLSEVTSHRVRQPHE